MTFCAEVAANGMLRRVLLVLCEFAEPNSNGKRLDGQSPNVQYPGNFGALCDKRIRIEDGVVQMNTKEQQALRLMPRAHNSRPRFFRKPKKIELHTLSRHVLEPFYQVFPTSLRILLQLLPLNHTSLSWFYDGDENTRLACLSKRFYKTSTPPSARPQNELQKSSDRFCNTGELSRAYLDSEVVEGVLLAVIMYSRKLMKSVLRWKTEHEVAVYVQNAHV